MPKIIPSRILTCAGGGHEVNKTENLMKGQKWTSKRDHNGKLEVELQIPLSFIEGIDIGNFWSATVEIEVMTLDRDHKELVKKFDWMSRFDVQIGKNAEKMTFLARNDLEPELKSRPWELIFIRCCQPWRKDIFGLSTFVVHGRKVEVDLGPMDKSEKNFTLASAKKGSLIDLIGKASLANAKKHFDSSKIFHFKKRVRQFLITKDPKKVMTREQLIKAWFAQNQEKLPEVMHETLIEVIHEFAKEDGGRKRKVSDNVLTLRNSDPLGSNTHEAKKRNDRSLLDVSLSNYESNVNEAKKRNDRSLSNISLSKEFNHNDLIHMSETELRQRNILTATHNYPTSRNLPLRSGKHICVEKGKDVKFFKVSDQVSMFYKGKHYFPRMTPQQMEKVFSSKEPELSQVNCPICNKSFDMKSIESHSANCGLQDQDQDQENQCPICQRSMPVDVLERHAMSCANEMFGS